MDQGCPILMDLSTDQGKLKDFKIVQEWLLEIIKEVVYLQLNLLKTKNQLLSNLHLLYC